MRFVPSAAAVQRLCLVAAVLGALLAAVAAAQDAGVAPEQPPSDTSGSPTPEPPEGTGAEPASASGGEAAAQPDSEAEGGGEPPAAVAAAEATIASTHIGELSSQTRVALQRARPLLRTSADIADIERRLPGVEAEIARLASPTRVAQITQVSQRELASLAQDWRRHDATLDGWRSALGERLAELEEARRDLVELRRTWAALRSALELLEASEGRRERVVTSLGNVRNTTVQLDAQRDRILELEERVSELSIVSEDVSEQIANAASDYRDRLFVRERAPVWVALGPVGGHTASIEAEARESWEQRSAAETDDLDEQLPGVVRLFLLFAVLAGAFMVLERRSRGWPADDRGLDLARAVASRPVSAALALVLLVTPIALGQAPILLYDIAFLLFIVPLVRVLSPIASPHVRRLVYIAAAVLVVNRIEGVMEEGSVLRRITLLAECGVAVVALVWWIRRDQSGPDRIASAVRGVAGATALAIGAALFANVIGYVFLATMLMRGTGFSLYVGLSLLVVVVVLRALLELALRSAWAHTLKSVREHGPMLRARALRLLHTVAVIGWAVSTLSAYGLWAPLARWGTELLEREWTVGTLTLSIGGVGGAVLILVATSFLARAIRFTLELDVLPRMALEPGVDGAISGLTRYVIVGIGILLAMAAVGLDASHIALVAGALGVGVGFGLQGIVANFIAGLVLMLERPVRLGDVIEVGPLMGRVDRIGLRSSTVRAVDGAEVIVPNESLISREVVNWTLSDRKRRVRLSVGVAYGTDLVRALEVVNRVLAEHPRVVEKPPPRAIVEAFADSSVNLIAEIWATDLRETEDLRSEVAIGIYRALADAGISIPFPQREVRILKDAEPAPGPRA